jgi:hypothetical protein
MGLPPMLRAALCAGLLGAPIGAAVSADEDGGKAGVSVLVPQRAVQPGEAVAISGMSPLDGKGPVTLRITPPGGKPPVPLQAMPASNGDYALSFGATELAGSYAVEASSPGGTARGKARFEVVVMEPLGDAEQALGAAKAELAALAKVGADIEADLDQQAERLPDSPARDELRQRWAAFKPQFRQAVRDLGELDSVLAPLQEAARSDPDFKPALQPFNQALRDWTQASAKERQRIVSQLTASRRASVTCENIERIVEGIKYAGSLANLAAGPVKALGNVAKDFAQFVARSAGGAGLQQAGQKLGLSPARADALSRKFKTAADKGMKVFDAVRKPAEARADLATNVLGAAFKLSAWVAENAFARYCERIAGPFSGKMHADFFAREGGQNWWSYDIEFQGRLDLRYAKGSVAGAAVAVKGDFVGQASRFTLAEDAIRIGFPKLTAGARLFKRAVLPKPLLFSGGDPPEDDKPIDIDGKLSATFVQPYGFFVPVEGEIVDGVLTLRVQPATSDYTANARVVYVIISPLTFVPVATAFELPYKDANFFFTRVSGGGPMRLAVRHAGKSLKVDEAIRQEKGVSVAKGRYELKLQLCNPEGKC